MDIDCEVRRCGTDLMTQRQEARTDWVTLQLVALLLCVRASSVCLRLPLE